MLRSAVFRKTTSYVLVGWLSLAPSISYADVSYVAQPGDTMSSIAANIFPGRGSIYRKNGRLSRLFRANPHVRQPDLLKVGVLVRIPSLSAPETRLPAGTDEPTDGEIALAQSESINSASTEDVVFTPRLMVSANAAFVNMSSRDRTTGEKARFASDLSPRIAVSLEQDWSDTVTTYARVGVTRVTILQPLVAGSIVQPKTQKDFSIGSTLRRASLGIGVEGGVRQSIFPRALTATSYTFDSVSVPYLGMRALFEPLKNGRQSAGLFLSYDVLGSSSSGAQRAETGSNIGGEIYWRYEFKSRRAYRLSAGYDEAQQNSNLTDQKSAALHLGLSLVWPLGD